MRHRRRRRGLWALVYRARMRAGLEVCRDPGCWTTTDLTFGHIVPHSAGSRFTFANITIQCEPCNRRQGSRINPNHISLADEEAAAPPERRWVARASAHPHAWRYLPALLGEPTHKRIGTANVEQTTGGAQ